MIKAVLSDQAADRLSGLLGATVSPGPAVRIGLAPLDAAFRRSIAAIGLVPAITALTGAPLLDRRAARRQRQDERAQLWSQIDSALARAGLATATWVPRWQHALRQSGILTRAGVGTAAEQATTAVAALGLLADTTMPELRSGVAGPVGAARSWELGELAAAVSGNAHGLDDDRLAAALTLRALAIAAGTQAPATAAERRAVWSAAGVSPDSVSSTAIVYGLRPPGDDPVSQMMRSRADPDDGCRQRRGARGGIAATAARRPVRDLRKSSTLIVVSSGRGEIGSGPAVTSRIRSARRS